MKFVGYSYAAMGYKAGMAAGKLKSAGLYDEQWVGWPLPLAQYRAKAVECGTDRHGQPA